MPHDDPFDLARFVAAQSGVLDHAAARARNSSWSWTTGSYSSSATLDLLGELARDGEISTWGGAGLLEERVDDDDAADLDEAVESTAGSRSPSRPQLEQPLALARECGNPIAGPCVDSSSTSRA